MVFFMFNVLMWEVIARLIDIGGIVDFHCLNFLFQVVSNFVITLIHKRWKK